MKPKHTKLQQIDPDPDLYTGQADTLIVEDDVNLGFEFADSSEVDTKLGKPGIVVHSKSLFVLFSTLVILCAVAATILSSASNNRGQSNLSSDTNSGNNINAVFRKRSEAFIDTCLQNYSTSKHNLIFQAYRGITITDMHIQSDLNLVRSNGHMSEFAMADLIRIHFLTSDYSQEIVEAAENFRFWLTHKEEELVYWSENEAILFMSCHWLFWERYGWESYRQEDLRARLTHYLKLKNTFGFYEFFSKVYIPYTLAALLNLVDFAVDKEIASLAEGAARRLLADMLLVTNDLGVAYSVAGRDFWKVLYQPTGHNFNVMVYLLTGLYPDKMTDAPPPSQLAGHLATTTLDMSLGGIFDYWNTTVDRTYYNGQSAQSIAREKSNLTFVDYVLALWTTGGCCDTSNIIDSYNLIAEYDMWEHPDLAELASYHGASAETLLRVTSNHASLLVARSTAGATINIYKLRSVLLTSLQLWQGGMYGTQVIPWVASTGTLAVWGAVGSASFAENRFLPEEEDGCESNGLPYVSQIGNVALIVYYPDSSMKAYLNNLGRNTDVTIHWPVQSYDETAVHEEWRFGREGRAYIGVKRGFSSESNDVVHRQNCLYSNATVQAWAVILGTEYTHGDFISFIGTVISSNWTSEMVSDGSTLQQQLHSTLELDGKILDITTFTK